MISCPSAQSDLATFLVLQKGYSRDACTDFDAKYVKRRGYVQGSAFWGSRNQYLRFGPPFSKKRHFWPPLQWDLKYFRPKTALTLDWSRVNDPLLLSEPNKSCIVNRQIGVGHSKNVIVFDPLLTGHVIRRMRSGHVRIYNANRCRDRKYYIFEKKRKYQTFSIYIWYFRLLYLRIKIGINCDTIRCCCMLLIQTLQIYVISSEYILIRFQILTKLEW